ncbi:response regulator transcription factor [Erythrobacter donghaensis]|uniref:response regulator transcription factor n=1 Tax=Erythrobacter donghaensis TaxID=267135 RepID=UPI00093FEE1D|nr:response regulator transcription factor [Erythrobacter donghaensis]
MKILLLEDVEFMADNIRTSLTGLDAAITIDHFVDLASALDAALSVSYDCLLLDRNVIGGDGLDVLTALRTRNVRTPALILSQLNTIDDRVTGLGAGADDYLGKDFEPRELLARIHAAVRRGQHESHPLILKRGAFELHRLAQKAYWNGSDLKLEPVQFDLLLCVAEAHPSPATYDAVWVAGWPSWSGLNIQKPWIQTAISRMRRKLRESGVSAEIKAANGGYVLEV